MGTTFAEYCDTAAAREKIAANVLEWSQMLCLSLEQNFIEESIRRQKFFAAGNPEDAEYYEKRIAELRDGKGRYKFEIETGRKYHKIIMVCPDLNENLFSRTAIGQVVIFTKTEGLIMKFSKRQLKKAAMYSLAVGLFIPAVSGIFYLVALAPAPIAFGAIFGRITFPGFVYAFR